MGDDVGLEDEFDDDDFDEEDDENAYAELESDGSGGKAKSVRPTAKVVTRDEIVSDLASLLFMAQSSHSFMICSCASMRRLRRIIAILLRT